MGTQEIKITDADHPYAKENGVVWAEEAWERVKHAPEFVRPGIRKLMVQRCVKRGYKIVTSDYLTEIRNESMMLVSKRVKGFGFEELTMDAFDVAKEKCVKARVRLKLLKRSRIFSRCAQKKKTIL